MSWWWSSTSPAASSEPAAGADSKPTTSPSLPPAQTESEYTLSTDPVPQTLSREEQANQDLMEVLKEFQAEADLERCSRIESRSHFPSSAIFSQPRSQTMNATSTPLPDDISPDSLYPTEIHCRSAFDYALFCQSFGGQFVNIYRYGSFRSCSNHWADFWLCMRTRNWDEKDRAKAIREHYHKKAIKYKTGPSSEDVWDVRREPVKDAFQDSLEELERRIEEWKRKNPDVEDPWDKQAGATFSSPKPL